MANTPPLKLDSIKNLENVIENVKTLINPATNEQNDAHLDNPLMVILEQTVRFCSNFQATFTTGIISKKFIPTFDRYFLLQTVNLQKLPFIQRGVHYSDSVIPGMISSYNIIVKKQHELFQANIFSYDFFEKVNFFSNNIVCVGANGSGKSSLSTKFKEALGKDGVVISAQRFLIIPKFSVINNIEQTQTELKKFQMREKLNKKEGDINNLSSEFAVLIKNLFAEENQYNRTFKLSALEHHNNGKPTPAPEATKLTKCIDIWNSMISHRKLSSADGFNIMVSGENIPMQYDFMSMSDGEKVLFYLIAQILQAPKDGFIVIDEPEMYLHKTIIKKIWDVLELERQDCLFIYLTHDLDFATSRTDATKLWIKSYHHPDFWEIQKLQTNEIPEKLMLELLGSRKNILFCEGTKDKSIDLKLYGILFSNLTIVPLGSCADVINFTKAFNKLNNVNQKAFGIIDSDYSGSDRIEKLKTDKVFCINVAEVENLLLDEEFLIQLADFTNSEFSVDELKKEILLKLNNDIILQCSKYVSNRITEYHKDSHVSQGNTIEQLKINLATFQDKLKIDDWYNSRFSKLTNIISEHDYIETIRIFNHKSLVKIAEKHLGITDLVKRSTQLLSKKRSSHESILKYFPSELVDIGVVKN